MKRIRSKGAGSHSGALLFFALAVISAAATGFLVYSKLQAPMAQVIVAARDIPAYTHISSQDIAVKSVPREGMPDGAITDTSGASVIGRFTTRGVLRGDTLREGHVSDDPMPTGPLAAALVDPVLGAGRMALSLPGDLTPGIVPELIPGDRLAVLGYVPDRVGEQGDHQSSPRILAPNATVMRVTAPVDELGSMSIRESTIVLAVTADEALSILKNHTDGVISLVLLPPDTPRGEGGA